MPGNLAEFGHLTVKCESEVNGLDCRVMKESEGGCHRPSFISLIILIRRALRPKSCTQNDLLMSDWVLVSYLQMPVQNFIKFHSYPLGPFFFVLISVLCFRGLLFGTNKAISQPTNKLVGHSVNIQEMKHIHKLTD